MTTDPIADMLARIRNAALAKHESTRIPASSIKLGIAQLLEREGYLAGVHVDDDETGIARRHITVRLKYGVKDGRAAFEGIRRVSRPGRRVYVGHADIPRVLGGLGTAILSTSHGLMTDKDARRARVGGELLCEVW